MCDYSLMEYSNRLAIEGEVLVVHRFASGCLGLASPWDSNVVPTRPARNRTFWAKVKAIFLLPELPTATAVCIPPGARLILHDVPVQVQRTLGVGPDEEVRFIQMSATENQPRDAVGFRTGHILRLQDLKAGQRVEVMSLGNSAVEEPDSSGRWQAIPVQGR